MEILKARNHIGCFLNERGLTGFGLEVGTYRGIFAEFILGTWEGQCLYMVDVWDEIAGSEQVLDWGLNRADMRHMAMETMGRVCKFPKRYVMLSAASPSVSSRFQDNFFDFIYIDACHNYEPVKADMETWWPKLKPGGLFAGDDYNYANGVRRAVDEWFALEGRPLQLTDYQTERNLRREPGESWWTIK